MNLRDIFQNNILFLCGLLFVLLLVCNWMGFIASDDAIYANGAYGWLEQFPYLGGHGSFRYVITIPIALAFLIIGENEFAMALPSIFAAVVLFLVLTTWLKREVDERAANILGILMATSPILVVWSSVASVDILEACFVFSSLYLFWLCVVNGLCLKKLLGAGALAAFAFLTRETTVFLLVWYGILFLLGYGIPRKSYWIMAIGFIFIWSLEILYFTLVAGDPLYRLNISFNHDASIDRSIDLAGNIIVHPLIDPLLVVMLNQEFGLLFWVYVICLIWLFVKRSALTQLKGTRGLFIFGGVGIVWFLCVGAAQNLLPLNPRYFLVSAISVSTVIAYVLSSLYVNHRRLIWGVCLAIASVNVMSIYLENKEMLFGEKVLVQVAQSTDMPIYTDPHSLSRAQILLKWARLPEGSVLEGSKSGQLFVWNKGRVRDRSELVRIIGEFQEENWQLVHRYEIEPKWLWHVFEGVGLEDYIPQRVKKLLVSPHPGVEVFLIHD